MAQTTGAMSWVDSTISISTNGSTWVDISGQQNKVTLSGGERITGGAYTADGDTVILTRGKRSVLTVTVSVVYTEATNSAYSTFQTAYESDTGAIYFRWLTKTGGLTFTTSAGVPKTPPYPTGDSASGDPLMVDLTIECASITET